MTEFDAWNLQCLIGIGAAILVCVFGLIIAVSLESKEKRAQAFSVYLVSAILGASITGLTLFSEIYHYFIEPII
jgi:hypothetical protein